jgi:hypothetical protein
MILQGKDRKKLTLGQFRVEVSIFLGSSAFIPHLLRRLGLLVAEVMVLVIQTLQWEKHQ